MRHLQLILAVLFSTAIGCAGADDAQRVTLEDPQGAADVSFWGKTMGTTWTVQIVGLPKAIPQAQLAGRFSSRLEILEGKLSHWQEDSPVSQFNRDRSTEPIAISEELTHVLQVALDLQQRSGGALDITAAPLVNLWGFGPAGPRGQVPSDAQIAAALEHVGSDRLRLQAFKYSGQLTKIDPQVALDLSAVAKGYAIDYLAEDLAALGVTNYLIELGGELRASGVNKQGRPWRVGLERPDDKQFDSVRRVLALSDAAVATSGNYRLFFDAAQTNGEPPARQGHILDPRTGRPVTHNLVSVSVITPAAVYADAWATALFVLGPEAGMQMAIAQELAATFVTADGAEQSTPQFAQYAVD